MPYDPDDSDSGSSPVYDTLRRNEARLLAIDGVGGVGVQSNDIGDETIVLYVRDSSVRARLPRTVEGVEVRGEVTGPIEAY